MKSVNCVRILGGRNDSLNLWFKGVDENGNIKVDFTDLISNLKAIIRMGYKPRIVLDNVPAKMSDGEMKCITILLKQGLDQKTICAHQRGGRYFLFSEFNPKF